MAHARELQLQFQHQERAVTAPTRSGDQPDEGSRAPRSVLLAVTRDAPKVGRNDPVPAAEARSSSMPRPAELTANRRSGHAPISSAESEAPPRRATTRTRPWTRPPTLGAGHARDAVESRLEEHRGMARSYDKRL